jgi:hypothetical protein
MFTYLFPRNGPICHNKTYFSCYVGLSPLMANSRCTHVYHTTRKHAEERTKMAGASIIKTPRRVKHNRKNGYTNINKEDTCMI